VAITPTIKIVGFLAVILVIQNQMDSVLITLILHTDIIAHINKSGNNTRLILSD